MGLTIAREDVREHVPIDRPSLGVIRASITDGMYPMLSAAFENNDNKQSSKVTPSVFGAIVGSPWLNARGTMIMNADLAARGWKFGFIQNVVSLNVTAYYKATTQGDPNRFERTTIKPHPAFDGDDESAPWYGAEAQVQFPDEYVVTMADAPQITFPWHLDGARLHETRGEMQLVTWLAVMERGTTKPQFLLWMLWTVSFDVDFDTSSPDPTKYNWKVLGKSEIHRTGEGQMAKTVDLKPPRANDRFKSKEGTW